jgi:WD40 repeat protein
MKLGPYEIEREIGRGGMGVVLRARGPDGGVVAIKCLIRQDRSDTVARFERERRLLGLLGEEAGFVPLLDFGDSPRGPYIVMPFLEGGTLRERLRKGPMELDEAVELGKTLALALGRAHVQGIVHRDLKPENVLFTERDAQGDGAGRALVSDLGLAKHWSRDTPGASQSVSLSVAGDTRGTAGYMAPEQMDNAKEVGPPSDVFALGAIIYECVAGGPAFEADSIGELFGQIVSGTFAPLRSRRQDAPRWLERVLERALEPRAARRFQDGAALAHALETRSDGRPRRAPALAGLALLALAASGSAAYGLMSRSAAPPAPPAPGPVPGGGDGNGKTSDPGVRPSHLKLAATWGNLDWRHDGPVTGVEFSLDGKTGFSSSEDKTIRIWDLATGHAVSVLQGHEQTITDLAVSRDRSTLASASLDGTIRIWNVASKKCIRVIDDRPNQVRAVAFSPDGKKIASGGEDCLVKIWDAATGKAIGTPFDRNSKRIESLAFLDSTLEQVVAGDDEGHMHVYSLEYGVDAQTLWVHDHVPVMSVAPLDDHRFLSGALDGQVTLWNIPKVQTDQELKEHKGAVLHVAASSDRSRGLSASRDGTLRIWDLTKGTEVGRLEPLSGAVRACAFSPDDRRALSGGDDGCVRLWDLEKEKEISSTEGNLGPITAVAISPDEREALSGGRDGNVVLRDAASGKVTKKLLGGADGPIHGAAYLRSGQPLSANEDHTAALWSREYGTIGYLFQNWHDAPVTGIAPLPDREQFITVCEDGFVRLFNVEPPALVHQARATPDIARTVSAARDRAITGGAAGDVRLWTVSPNELAEVARLGSFTTAVTASALAPDGRRALTGTGEGELTLWDLDKNESAALSGHTGPVTAVAFFPGEKRALSAARDGTVRVWDLGSRREVDRVSIAPDLPNALAVFADGRTFLVGTERSLVLRYAILN